MRQFAGALLLIGTLSMPAVAQQSNDQAAAVPSAAPKPVTLTTGADFPTAYVFRGIMQEDEGFIAQPPLDFGLTLGHGVTVNIGKWDSLHSADTGTHYESDYYAAVTFTAGKLKPGVLFTSYTSPNERFGTVKELAAVVAYDDSGSRFPLSPRAMVAFEIDGQADGGTSEGTYLELGIRPGLAVAPRLTLAVPVKLGISLSDYYEGPTGSNRFGYLDAGLIASVPLVSGSGGTLEAHGGVDLLFLGDNVKLLNGGDRVKPVGVFGIGFTY
jgi:hypothetical protein